MFSLIRKKSKDSDNHIIEMIFYSQKNGRYLHTVNCCY